jgi:Glutathione S-transferase, C-terminal domain
LALQFLKYFEHVIAENKGAGWLVGPRLTVTDLVLYHLSSWLDGGLDGGIVGGEVCVNDSSVLDSYPLVRQHKESIDNLFSVIEFRDQYKSPYSTFDFVPPNVDASRSDKNVPDNLPRGAKRRLSTDGLPKNVSRCKSSDQITKHPGAPSPAKRRSSKDDNDLELQEHETKKTDKMMSTPMRRKPSFEVDEVEDEFPRRKPRGVSLPPRPRPTIIDDDDDDDKDFNFSDESEELEDLNNSAKSLLDFAGMKNRNELWDDSSTDSFDDESSFSSVEHNLEGLKVRLQSGIGKEKKIPSSSDPGSRKKKAGKKKKRKRKKDKKNKKSRRESDTIEKIAPKLPANTPRHVKRTRKSDSILGMKKTPKPPEEPRNVNSAKPPKDNEAKEVLTIFNSTKPPKDDEAKTTKSNQSAQEAEEPSKKPKKTDKPASKEATPKNEKKVKRLPAGGSRKGVKRFPSNDPRISIQSGLKGTH